MRTRKAITQLRTLLSVALCVALVGLAPTARAETGMASIVVDADTGKVLLSAQPTRRWYPASLTKLMTLYLTFDALENGTLNLEETLTVSENAANQPEVSLGLKAGDTIPVENAITALVVRSANDVAMLLAEKIGGSEQRFAAMMSLKARALGMNRTVFRNPSGLPDDRQTTTARDMAILAEALLTRFPEYYEFFNSRYYIHNGQALATYNQFLEQYKGADGFKTGFTCGSGYNLVASVERDGRRLIGVVLGATSNGKRNAEMVRLMDQGFAMDLPEDAPSLADLPNAVDGPEAGDPPFRLPADQCQLGAAVASDGTLNGVLPGWAVVFGAYVDKAQAETALSAARDELKDFLPKGRPAVVQRETEGVSRYAALLVGLQQEDAGTACRYLWERSVYCLALTPEVLNNPNALWR